MKFEVRLDTVLTGADRGSDHCWVHARAGVIPGDCPSVVLTMNTWELGGDDNFDMLWEMRTDDLGMSWRGPVGHRDTLGRRLEADGIEVVVSDFTPGNAQRVEP